MEGYFKLTLFNGTEVVSVWNSGSAKITLGSSPTSSIPLYGPGIESRHVVLWLLDNRIQVEEQGAALESQVNGYPIEGRVEVEVPATVQIGNSTLLVEAVPENGPLPEPTDSSLDVTIPVKPHESNAANRFRNPNADTPHGTLAAISGQYELVKEIARGGMGLIYHGEDPQLERQVAVKVSSLVSDGSDPRFEKEAKVLANLAHPNIVPIHAIGRDSKGRPFYSMKLVKGRTLQAILSALQKNEPDALRDYTRDRLLTAFRKVCDAMSFAHSKGILHRDLKPENVMLGEFGEVLVMDWGLAKVIGEAAPETAPTGSGVSGDFSMTMEGEVMGTPQYMSPEQAEGKIGELDERSDIYGLGGILYAILTLRAPIEGTSLEEVLTKVKRGEISSMTSRSQKTGSERSKRRAATPLGKEVPQELRAVTMKALAKNPKDRYAAVPDLERDVESYLNGFATRAESASYFRKLLLLIKRHKAIAAMVAVLLLVGAAFTIKLTATEKVVKSEKQHALEQRKIAEQKAKEAEQHRDTAQATGQKLAASQLTEVEQRQRAEKSALEAEENRAVAETNAQKATTNEQKAIANEQRALASEQKALASEKKALEEQESARRQTAIARVVLAEALDRDFDGAGMRNELANVPEDLRGSTWEYLNRKIDTSLRTVQARADKPYAAVLPVPQVPSTFITILSYGTVQKLNVQSGQIDDLFGLDPWVLPPYVTAISDDGQSLAISYNGSKTIDILRLPDGKKLTDVSFVGILKNISFSPNGSQLIVASSSPDGSIDQSQVLNLSANKVAYQSAPKDRIIGGFSDDGKNVRFLSNTAGFYDWDTSTGKILRKIWIPFGGINASVIGKQYVADRSWSSLFFVHKKRSLFALDLNQEKVLFESQLADGKCLNICSESKIVVTSTQRSDGCLVLQFWNAVTGAVVKSAYFFGDSYLNSQLCVHPLSKEVIATLGPTLKVWTWVSPKPLQKFSGTGAEFFAVPSFISRFSAEGLEILDLRHPQPESTPVFNLRTHTFDPATRDGRMSVSTDGSTMVFQKGPDGKFVYVYRWDGKAVKKISEWKVNFKPSLLQISPDGSRCYAGEGIYDTISGELLRNFDRNAIVSPQGGPVLKWTAPNRIAELMVIEDIKDTVVQKRTKAIVLSDTDSGQRLANVFTPETNTFCVSPDRKWIAEGGKDKRIRIRNATTLEVQREIRVYDGEIQSLVWHPSLPILVSAGDDESVRIWDIRTGKLLEELNGVGAQVRLMLSLDGKTLGIDRSTEVEFYTLPSLRGERK
ncbi:MAG: protein kinase [Verrucomicrobiota bacterium]